MSRSSYNDGMFVLWILYFLYLIQAMYLHARWFSFKQDTFFLFYTERYLCFISFQWNCCLAQADSNNVLARGNGALY